MQRLLRFRQLRFQLKGLATTSPFSPTTHFRAMAAKDTSSTNSEPSEGSAASEASSNQPLPLPEPSPHSQADTLDLSTGQGVKLDHLGPMIVNRDGTLSRISNWEHMTDIERRNTLRILGKRNQLRMEALKNEESPA